MDTYRWWRRKFWLDMPSGRLRLLIVDTFHAQYSLNEGQGAEVLSKDLAINAVPYRIVPAEATLHVLLHGVLVIDMMPQHGSKWPSIL